MNVLFLDQYSDPGGAQQALIELLPAVRERGWSAVVGLPGNGRLFDQVHQLGIAMESIGCGPYGSGRKSLLDMGRFLAQAPALARQVRELADRTRADVVYLNGPRLVPALALAGLNCPVIFHSHSWLPPGASRIATGLALRRMDACVIANCEFVAAQWLPFMPADRISVVLNGVAGPAEAPRRRSGPPRVGCMGRISREKGQREFVTAAARIHESLPQCRFAIFGAALFDNADAERYEAEVRSMAAGLPIDFRGWVSDVYDALAELDLLLVPSSGPEATTRVILEAFAAGGPVIAFDTGGIAEVVMSGVTGILTRSVEEMAREAVALLAGDPERRITMARAARAEWERRFTLEKYQDNVLRLIERHQRQPLTAAVASEIA